MSAEKLQHCQQMLKFLDKDHVKFKYDAGNQGALPITLSQNRFHKTFVLHMDGSLDYVGTSEQLPYGQQPRLADIELKGLVPTDAIVTFAFSKLRKACLDQARESVIQRLINHQLQYNGLDFLIEK